MHSETKLKRKRKFLRGRNKYHRWGPVTMVEQDLSLYYYELHCLKVYYSALLHKVQMLDKSSKGMDFLPC
jgi:hypothetical protein